MHKLREILYQIQTNFKENIAIVEKLMKFDEVVQFLCLKTLKKADEGQKKIGCDNHPSCNLKPMIKQIENIRQHESLQPSYEIMFNQCVVLLVSYFSSAIEDIFRESLEKRIRNKHLGQLENQEIKLTLAQLIYEESIVDIFISKRDISFQDMQSIGNAFEEYIEIPKIIRDKDVNNIILSQACRHCIVHNGSMVNKKVLNQLKTINPRDLKQVLSINEKILFNEDEIKIIIKSMSKYIDNLVFQLVPLQN